jgi:hypothetical protein
VEPSRRKLTRKKAHAVLSPDGTYHTAAERRAEGKALRNTVPREDQGSWKPPKARHDPIELLIDSNKGRIPELVPIRLDGCCSRPLRFSGARPA